MSKRMGEAASLAVAACFPRRCPFCGSVLRPAEAVADCCENCAPKVMALEHHPPRLPTTEHLLQNLTGAASAYYYAAPVSRAILMAKNFGCAWYAQELADRIAVLVFGAEPAKRPGGCPIYVAVPGFSAFDCIVPVPPHRTRLAYEPSLPAFLAKRLGRVMQVPVLSRALQEQHGAMQKGLSMQERMKNRMGAFSAAPGVDLSGRRVLLLDDVITTGATVSACAGALISAGAESVFAVSVAASETVNADKKPSVSFRDHS